MIGTILNASGIVLGGLIGLKRKAPLPDTNESFFKVALGVFSVFYGLRLTYLSLNGTFFQVMKQILIAIVAMMIGKLVGRMLRLQKLSNQLGRAAKERIAEAKPGVPVPFSAGFQTCSILFCAAPLGILGALQDGLVDYWYPLAVKAVMDGLATMGFVLLFRWSAMFSALPVLAWQGTITLITVSVIKPFLAAHGLVDPVNAVGGLLVFCVALIILGIKKIELADYLPSLAIAPLLSWLFR
jgi:uncharacterized membrane protein YqgA involved in biofilm formation